MRATKEEIQELKNSIKKAKKELKENEEHLKKVLEIKGDLEARIRNAKDLIKIGESMVKD